MIAAGATFAGVVDAAGAAATTTTASAAADGSSAASGTPGSVLYGLGDGGGQFARCADPTAACCYDDPASCPPDAITGYWNNPLFRALASPHSAHRVDYVRLFVSIDAVAQFNGSTTHPGCVASQVLQSPWTDTADRAHPAGQSLQDLMAGLVAAHADGLTPVISLSGYPVASLRPSFAAAALDPTTPAGYWGYRCGVDGILGAVSRLPVDERPHVWEPFNEPDRVPLYTSPAGSGASAAGGGASASAGGASASAGPDAPAPGCAVSPGGIPDGPAKAACDYVLADRLIHDYADHADDTVLAGVFSRPSPVYLQQYAAQLSHLLPATEFPSDWAVHDYGAVTRAYAGSSLGPLETFDHALGTDTDGRATSLWITETGMLLTSRNHAGRCPAAGADPAGTIGACINGNAKAQFADLFTFFELPHAGTTVPITHLFWYQWQGELNWDSGLLDDTGRPRPAWCAFYGSGHCTGSIDAS